MTQDEWLSCIEAVECDWREYGIADIELLDEWRLRLVKMVHFYFSCPVYTPGVSVFWDSEKGAPLHEQPHGFIEVDATEMRANRLARVCPPMGWTAAFKEVLDHIEGKCGMSPDRTLLLVIQSLPLMSGLPAEACCRHNEGMFYWYADDGEVLSMLFDRGCRIDPYVSRRAADIAPDPDELKFRAFFHLPPAVFQLLCENRGWSLEDFNFKGISAERELLATANRVALQWLIEHQPSKVRSIDEHRFETSPIFSTLLTTKKDGSYESKDPVERIIESARNERPEDAVVLARKFALSPLVAGKVHDRLSDAGLAGEKRFADLMLVLSEKMNAIHVLAEAGNRCWKAADVVVMEQLFAQEDFTSANELLSVRNETFPDGEGATRLWLACARPLNERVFDYLLDSGFDFAAAVKREGVKGNAPQSLRGDFVSDICNALEDAKSGGSPYAFDDEPDLRSIAARMLRVLIEKGAKTPAGGYSEFRQLYPLCNYWANDAELFRGLLKVRYITKTMANESGYTTVLKNGALETMDVPVKAGFRADEVQKRWIEKDWCYYDDATKAYLLDKGWVKG